MAIDLLCFSGLTLLLPLAVARALGIWIAMTWNFLLNRQVTFAYAPRNRPVRQYVLYCGSCAAGAVGSWVTSMALCKTSDFFLAHPVIAAIIGVGVGFGLNYCACRCFVFGARPRKEAAVNQVSVRVKVAAGVEPPSEAELQRVDAAPAALPGR
jgi:dolichol-phosphate mannosyltransferase